VELPELHRRACDELTSRLRTVRADQWHLPTPCQQWDVRQLVAHVVSEALWTVPLMKGLTIAEIGDGFGGDVLNDDPLAEWEAASAAAVRAVESLDSLTNTVHLSFGDFPGEFYAHQLFADYLVHAWDLARATGGDEKLDPELVSECASWFTSMENEYRQAGVVGSRPASFIPTDEQSRLLWMFGRDASPEATFAVIRRFNEAFASRDTRAVNGPYATELGRARSLVTA